MIQKLNQADVILGGGGGGVLLTELVILISYIWLGVFVVCNFSYLEIVDILFIV